ncbi:MAG: polysaccharide deacetylase family protein [Lachnospiraceae bacterium]|nr:polysaccharide deacetylase family protein [Lachnospiraceae bacterium]
MKYIALTFDDGPNNSTTTQVLDILEEKGVKATFFLEGDKITEDTRKQVEREMALGCEINNHSRTHRPFTELTDEEIKEEIKTTTEKIVAITGKEPKFFRPPYIAMEDRLYDLVDLYFICGRGVDDWVPSVSAEERYERVVKSATSGEMILLHDLLGNDNTVEALPKIIDALKDEFEFVTVSELFEKCGRIPQKGILYTSVYQDK